MYTKYYNLYPLFLDAVKRAVNNRERVAIYSSPDGEFYIGVYYGDNTFVPGHSVEFVFDPTDWKFTYFQEKYTYFGITDTEIMAITALDEWESRQEW